MKLAIVILAVVAAASAQFNPNYNQPGQYNQGKYNPYSPFGQQKYNRFQYSTPAPYRPFVSTTPAPLVSFAPSTYAPLPTPVAPRVVPVRVSNLESRNANIVKYENVINPDGSYAYAYENDNGIAAQEQGVPRSLGGNPPVSPVVAQGSFSYTSPEGVPIFIEYIADENGFQAKGDSIPQPPPIPELILRSLEYNARFAKE